MNTGRKYSTSFLLMICEPYRGSSHETIKAKNFSTAESDAFFIKKFIRETFIKYFFFFFFFFFFLIYKIYFSIRPKIFTNIFIKLRYLSLLNTIPDDMNETSCICCYLLINIFNNSLSG